MLSYELGDKIMAIHLIVTDACNMSCEYCFYLKRPNFISEENAKAAMDWLCSPKISGERDVHVTFFGGEPTMNEKLIMDTVIYGHEVAKKNNKKINFGIVSNFLMTTEDFIGWCADNNVSFLASYDGALSQDQVRRARSNDRVRKNIRVALKKGAQVMVAQQVAPGHTQYLYDNLMSIYDIGIKHVFQNPVHHGMHAYSEKDFAYLAREFRKISDLIVRQRKAGVSPSNWSVSNFDKHISGLHQLIINPRRMNYFMGDKIDRTCGACKGSLAVTAAGDIVPCQQMTVEYPQWIMGNVQGNSFDKDLRKKFRSEDRQHRQCTNCAVTACAPCFTINRYATGDERSIPDDVCRYQRLLHYNAVVILNQLLGTRFYPTELPQQKKGQRFQPNSLNQVESPHMLEVAADL